MEPPIYQLCLSSHAVTAVFGIEPRVYPHGDAGENEIMPYAVWSTIGGTPSNSLGDRPGSDNFYAQVDVWHSKRFEALEAARLIRDAIEGGGYVDAWRGAIRDPTTRLYRVSFDVSFHVKR